MSYERKEHQGGAVATTLQTGIGSGDTSLVLVLSTNWPTGGTGPFYLVIDAGLSTEEKILATARSSSTLTGLTRGADGTTAAAHTAGATIQHIFSAQEADEANALVKATLGTITAKGDSLIGTASATIGKLAIGADNTVNVADSAQTTGQKWATLTSSSLAANSVTSTQIATTAIGTTMTGAGGTAIDVATSGIGTTQLAANAVTLAKIATAIRPVQIVTSGTRPGSPSTGDYIYETDTNRTYAWNGAAWKRTASGATGEQSWVQYQSGTVTGGPTSGSTELTLATLSIASQPFTYDLDVAAMWSGLNSVDGDAFKLRIKVDGTEKGAVTVRHVGGSNIRLPYVIPCITPVSIAATTASTVLVTIQRTLGTGTVNEETAGVVRAIRTFTS